MSKTIESIISKPLPTLCLDTLKRATGETSLQHIQSDQWVFNHHYGISKYDADVMTLITYKGHRQMDNVYNRLLKLHTTITDFAASNFQEYVDEHNRYREDDDEEDDFDPYVELQWLVGSETIDELPLTIETYSELKAILSITSRRHEAMSNAFAKFFPNVKMHYLGKDEDGNEAMIPEDAIPGAMVQEMRTNREVEDGLLHIEIEHCLDNYDEWIAAMIRMINERARFSEMLLLFK